MPQYPSIPERVDLAVIGAGAAGLMASIWAGRTAHASSLSICAFDSAKKIGAKILVAGGGRCNVTHFRVDQRDYAGSSPNAIKKVLKRFPIKATTEFFESLGVELKQEDTGKLFPVTDSARTVLDALLGATTDAGVPIVHPIKITDVSHDPEHADPFDVTFEHGVTMRARSVILSTGGMALPRSGSDGTGIAIARSLGVPITPRVFPALVPIKLDPYFPLCAIKGIASNATLEVRSASNKKLHSFTGSTLCTHFGLSGPAPLNISRYLTQHRGVEPDTKLLLNWLPDVTFDQLDTELTNLGPRSVGRYLRELGDLPTRLVETICAMAALDPATPGHALTKPQRRALITAATASELPVIGDRGFTFAETTAGGVPLDAISLSTMESKDVAGLYLCGEICDVDGRIGGFNFQWAWASGLIAGTAATNRLLSEAHPDESDPTP